MTRTKEYIIAGIGIGTGILALYWMHGRKKEIKFVATEGKSSGTHQEVLEAEKPAPQIKTLSKSQSKVQHEWQLKFGSSGKEVERLQVWLLRHHGWKGSITGVFDQQTLELVNKRFKKDTIDKATYKKYKMGIPVYNQIKTNV